MATELEPLSANAPAVGFFAEAGAGAGADGAVAGVFDWMIERRTSRNRISSGSPRT